MRFLLIIGFLTIATSTARAEETMFRESFDFQGPNGRYRHEMEANATTGMTKEEREINALRAQRDFMHNFAKALEESGKRGYVRSLPRVAVPVMGSCCSSYCSPSRCSCTGAIGPCRCSGHSHSHSRTPSGLHFHPHW